MDTVEPAPMPTPEIYPMPAPMPEPSLEMINFLWLGIFLFVSFIILVIGIIAIYLLVKKKTLGCCLLGALAGLLILFNGLAFYLAIKPLVVDQWEYPEPTNEIIFEDEYYDQLYEEEDAAEDEISTTAPAKTVENFIYAALGTLDKSNLDPATAKSYLAPNLAAEYDDPMFFQKNMCIQDGPSKIQVGATSNWDTAAQVTIEAQYGADLFEPFWDFYLVQINDQWLISQIVCLKN